MKKFKKVIFLIVSVLFITTLQDKSVSAAGPVEFSVNQITGTAGSKQTVKIDMTNNAGVAGLDFTLNYDTSLVQCIDSKKGSALKLAGYSDTKDNAQNGTLRFVYASLSGMTKEGSALEVTFQLIRDIDEGYVPQLTINDVADDSDEVKAMSYIVLSNESGNQTTEEMEANRQDTSNQQNNQSNAESEATEDSATTKQADQQTEQTINEQNNTSSDLSAKIINDSAEKALEEEKQQEGKEREKDHTRKMIIVSIISFICILTVIVLFVIFRRVKRKKNYE